MHIVILLVWKFNDKMNIEKLFYEICSTHDSQKLHTLGREGSGGSELL
jgi:hypothetical protein